MFETDDHLSSDLEYLLASGQADPAELAEVLVDTYYRPVYRLALGLLWDGEAAGRAARQTLVTAILNAYRYQEGTRVDDWLWSQALEACRRSRRGAQRDSVEPDTDRPAPLPGAQDAALWAAYDALPEHLRLPLLLEAGLGWTLPEISRRTGIPEDKLPGRLQRAWAQVGLRLAMPDASPAGRSLDAAGLPEALARSLARRWPAPELTPGERQAVIDEIFEEAAATGRRRQFASRIREAALTVLAIVVVAGVLWAYSALNPEPEPATSAFGGPAALAPTRPAPAEPTPTEEPRTGARLGSQLSQGRDRQRFYFYYRARPGDTLVNISHKLDIPLGRLIRHNRARLDRSDWQGAEDEVAPGLQLVITISPEERQPRLSPYPPVAQRFFPVTAEAAPEDVISHLASSGIRYLSLWAEVYEVDYGPAGYNGPPRTTPSQVWIRQPDQQLTVSVLPYERDYTRTLFLDGTVYTFPSRDNANLIDVLTSQGEHPYRMDSLFRPASSEWFQDISDVRIVEDDIVAGRKALVVEWPGEGWLELPSRPEPVRYRLAIDSLTGVVLHLREYTGPEEAVLTREMVVTRIVYEPASVFPERFSLQKAREARFDQDGLTHSFVRRQFGYRPDRPAEGHEWLEPLSPPAGFDPSGSRLTFQYPQEMRRINWQGQQTYPVDLFAGPYFLHRIEEFPAPQAVFCQRSPDGGRLAYLSTDTGKSAIVDDQDSLRILDLAGGEETLSPWPGRYISDFAFSPDGQRMAVLVHEPGSSIYLYDIESGEKELLRLLSSAYSLIWSPDGRYLTFGGSLTTGGSSGTELVVMDVETKDVVYRAPEPEGWWWRRDESWPPPDWPGQEWGVSFPAGRDRGIEGCLG